MSGKPRFTVSRLALLDASRCYSRRRSSPPLNRCLCGGSPAHRPEANTMWDDWPGRYYRASHSGPPGPTRRALELAISTSRPLRRAGRGLAHPGRIDETPQNTRNYVRPSFPAIGPPGSPIVAVMPVATSKPSTMPLPFENPPDLLRAVLALVCRVQVSLRDYDLEREGLQWLHTFFPRSAIDESKSHLPATHGLESQDFPPCASCQNFA